MAGVKINRHKRRVVHEVFPITVMRPIGAARGELDWIMGAYKDGFTPGELRRLKELRTEMLAMSKDLSMIYFRLKR